MNIHKNARLTPNGRERIAQRIESGQTPEAAARAAGVCPRPAWKWYARFKAEGLEGLKDLTIDQQRELKLDGIADVSMELHAQDSAADLTHRGMAGALARPRGGCPCCPQH